MGNIATGILLSITGQDRTAGAFSSVASRAAGAQASLKRAIAFATAGLGVAGIAYAAKKGVDSLGEIADAAQKAGVSASYLQQLSTALDQVGIKGADMDGLAGAFVKMQKNTGASGAKGFESTMAGIASIGDEQERLNRLTEVFGKELGGNLAPLVRQGPDNFREGLAGVMAAMPAVSDKAVEMGDTVSDALKMAGIVAKTQWQQALGDMAAGLEKHFGMPLGEVFATFLANVRWAFATAWLVVRTFFGNVAKVVQFFRDDWKGALEWVWNGVKGVFMAVFNFVWQVLKSLGMIAASFGKEIWSAIKGDGFHWGNIADEAIEQLGKVKDAGTDVLKSLVPRSNDKIHFDVIDWDEQFRKRNELIATAREGVRAQAKLATGGVIEEEAKDAVKAVRDATKQAAFSEVGTNNAMRLILANTGQSAGVGLVMGGPQAVRGMGIANGPQRGESQQASLLQTLIGLVRTLDDHLVAQHGTIAELEAV